jgi:hypothetical protein
METLAPASYDNLAPKCGVIIKKFEKNTIEQKHQLFY